MKKEKYFFIANDFSLRKIFRSVKKKTMSYEQVGLSILSESEEIKRLDWDPPKEVANFLRYLNEEGNTTLSDLLEEELGRVLSYKYFPEEPWQKKCLFSFIDEAQSEYFLPEIDSSKIEELREEALESLDY